MRISKKIKSSIFRDLLMIFIGIIFAILVNQIGLIDFIANNTKNYYIISSFIAGIFFTSIFTIAPSSVVLAHLSDYAPTSHIAFWGGLGAVLGDLILFFFIRDRFFDNIIKIIKPSTIKYFMHSLHFGFIRWLSPFIGALIIASPLPDELGIALFGMSKIKTSMLIPITFVMNVLGIYLLIVFENLI